MRAGHRGSTTRLIAQAEVALTAEPLNSVDLELAVAKLKKRMDVLTPLDAEILELTADDDIDVEIDHADQYQENIQHILSKLNKVLIIPAPRTEHNPRVQSTLAAPKALSTVTPIMTDHLSGGVVTPDTSHTHGTKVKLALTSVVIQQGGQHFGIRTNRLFMVTTNSLKSINSITYALYLRDPHLRQFEF